MFHWLDKYAFRPERGDNRRVAEQHELAVQLEALLRQLHSHSVVAGQVGCAALRA